MVAGCGGSSNTGQQTPSNAPGTTAAVVSTSAGSANPSAGSENSNNESTNNAPAPEPTTVAPAALWDPCGLPEAVITKLGFRPDSKEVISGSGDKSCRWPSVTGKSEVTITSTRKSVQDFIETGRYVDFNPIPVGDRAGYQFHAAQDTNKIGCYVAVPVPSGLAVFTTRNLKPDAPQEPCVAAQRISGGLVGYLP
ncbi:DUF3558 domain-containing protein [Nocardia colli]|uniref:DUF3558 domain-containing protein n=1 Tax=Nocardia colli TaxID=2545717 RepID=UPI0035D53468